MRAARFHEVGGRPQVDDVPEPEAGDGEVVVEMAFASVNPLDVWVSRGSPGAAAQNLPWTPLSEGTGFVDGEPVLVRGGGLGVARPGLARERAAVPATSVQRVPAGLDLRQVAGLPVPGVTAWNAVHTKGQVTAADRVLVLGASGGVGSMAVQLAKAAGARVWGQTSNADKAGGIEALGADEVVVAGASDLAEAAAALEPTVVLDPLGGAFTDQAAAVLAPHGRLVVYGTSNDEMVTVNLRRLYRKGITLYGYSGLVEPAERQQQVLDELFALLAAGRLHVPIGAVLPLGSLGEAWDRILGRRVEGKIVIDCRA